MGQIRHIETLIEQERKALYACAKAKCKECPLGHTINKYCMIVLLENFNKIIEVLRSKSNGKALHK